MKYYVLIGLILLILLIIGAPAALAQQDTAGTAEAGTSIGTRFLGPADQKFIDIAKQDVKQRLGEDYYNQFISFQAGNSYEECLKEDCAIKNRIHFSYALPFETNGDSNLGLRTRIFIQIILDDKGEVTSYAIPSKPYQFLVPQEEIIAKAKSYGLKDVTEAGVVRTSGSEYELVWAVSSHDLIGECQDIGGPTKECIYKGVYVDVDSGEIRGEYRINSLVRTPLESGNIKLGEFSSSPNAPAVSDQFDTFDTMALTIIVIIVLSLVVLVWYKFLRIKGIKA